MKPSLDLFVFSDALGWELVKRHAFAEKWLPVRLPCRTLPGYSCTCDPTILTGAQPDAHKHFSFFVKAARSSPFSSLRFLSFIPHKLAGHHRIRNRVSRAFARKHGYTGYFQLYSVPFSRLPYLDYTEKKDIYEPGGIIGGQETFFEDWKRSGLKWMRSDWRLGDAKNLDSLEDAVETGKPELAYLFTAGLDALMHRHGTTGELVEEAFRRLDARLKRILDKASSRYHKVRVRIFSDHGMTDVANACDTLNRWEALGFRYGRDYVAAWDSTMARFWFEDETVRSEALDWLGRQTEGDVLSESFLRAEHCWFEDQRYGETFFLLKPGNLFVPSFMNMGFVTGMHGYTPDDRHSTAAFLSTESGESVRELKDLYGLMKGAAYR